MKDADYIVQLSDNEGFCYAVYEALQIGKPCIVSRWDGVEKAIRDDENGYILDMDMSNLNNDFVSKIYDKIPTGFILESFNPEEEWNKALNQIEEKPVTSDVT